MCWQILTLKQPTVRMLERQEVVSGIHESLETVCEALQVYEC